MATMRRAPNGGTTQNVPVATAVGLEWACRGAVKTMAASRPKESPMNASPSSLVQIGTNLAVASTASKRSSLKPEVKPQSWEWTKLCKITLRQMDKFIDLFPLVLRNEDLMAVDHM